MKGIKDNTKTIYHFLGLEDSTIWEYLYYPKQFRFGVISIKLKIVFFTELWKKNFTIYMKIQNTPNSHSLEKEEWSWRNQPSWLWIILQSYNHQHSMVLAQKQIYRPMEQDRKPRNKPMHLCISNFWQRIYNGAKTASSINGGGKTGQLHVKEWNSTIPNIIQKDKLKMH